MPLEYVPPRDAISIEDLGSSLKIVIPNRFDGRISFFMMGLSVLFLSVLLKFFPLRDFLWAILIIFLGFLIALLDPFNVSRVFRELLGYEELIVTDKALYLTDGRGKKTTEYPFSQIRDFCPCQNFKRFYLGSGSRRKWLKIRPEDNPYMMGRGFQYPTGGGLCFICDNFEVRFANGADAQEGRRILNAIQEKFPYYAAVISFTIGYTG